MVGRTNCGPNRRAADPCSYSAELLLPKLRMGLLDRGQPAIDLGEMRVALGLGQCAVERGAVDLASKIRPVAANSVALAHKALLRHRCENTGINVTNVRARPRRF